MRSWACRAAACSACIRADRNTLLVPGAVGRVGVGQRVWVHVRGLGTSKGFWTPKKAGNRWALGDRTAWDLTDTSARSYLRLPCQQAAPKQPGTQGSRDRRTRHQRPQQGVEGPQPHCCHQHLRTAGEGGAYVRAASTQSRTSPMVCTHLRRWSAGTGVGPRLQVPQLPCCRC